MSANAAKPCFSPWLSCWSNDPETHYEPKSIAEVKASLADHWAVYDPLFSLVNMDRSDFAYKIAVTWPGKKHGGPEWVDRATADPDQLKRNIKRMEDLSRSSRPDEFAQYGQVNAALLTGKETGLFAIDVDGPEGRESLKKIEAECGPLPKTVRSKSPNGEHIFFRYDGDLRIPNGWTALPKIEPKYNQSDGQPAHVSIPPTKTDKGESVWVVAPWEMDPAPIPLAFLSFVERELHKKKKESCAVLSPTGDVIAPTEVERIAIRKAEHGRNKALYWFAGTLRGNGLSKPEVERCASMLYDKIKDMADGDEFPPSNVKTAVDSAFKAPKPFEPMRHAGPVFNEQIPSRKIVKVMPDGTRIEVEQRKDPASGSDRPKIALPGVNRSLLDFVKDVTPRIKAGLHWFVRGESVVRVKNGQIQYVKAAAARTELEAVAEFGQRVRVRKGKDFDLIWNVYPVGRDTAEGLLAAPYLLDNIQKIEQVSSVPLPYVIDGKLRFCESGYNSHHSVFTTWNTPRPEPLPLGVAKSLISELLCDFCFRSDADYANAVGFLLTPFLRLIINDMFPGIMVRGNRVGLGKNLLIKVLSIPILNQPAAVTIVPNDDDEMRKRLFAMAGSGDPFAWFDELSGHFKSPALNAALTTGLVGDRIMATNRFENRRFDALICLSGNNYTISPDLARRVVPINLEFMPEDIHRRKYRHPSLEHWAIKRRTDLIGAVYGLVANWVHKGMKRADCRLASFDNWAAIVGGILEGAGIDGFMSNQDEMMQTVDLETADMRKLVSLWAEKFDYPIQPKDLTLLCQRYELFAYGKSDSQSLGYLLKGWTGREVADFRIVRTSVKPPKYRVEKIERPKK